jgi:hypothetical protein
MNLQDIKARINRLENLGIGFGKEYSLWKECNDSLLYAERQAFLSVIREALIGIEAARVALALAKQRIEANPRGLEGQV